MSIYKKKNRTWALKCITMKRKGKIRLKKLYTEQKVSNHKKYFVLIYFYCLDNDYMTKNYFVNFFDSSLVTLLFI